jgi:HAD superfamily hydrolase (TIGR01509 family)
MFPLPGSFQAAVFDMDGLLIDSEPLWGRAEAALVEAHGGRLTRADRLATIGRSIDASIAIHAERLGLPAATLPDLRRELIGTVRELYATEGEIRPGAAELVDRLTDRMAVGLASNSDRALVDLALGRIGLAGRFGTIVTAGDVGRAKPAPDAYLELCRRLGVEPSRAIGFEDSPSGVEALRAAGIASVGVLAGGALDLAAADVVVETLVEVLDWIDVA